ncbi:YolD-like family protein [Peribacillus saganii]|uniref:YolD-like family protein n=1 Tax=Peribacillus saganii TaxID=2303992 RepID=A0A372LQ70_9BACI|nr:YolD-like family protein [Peribacillus saganii]RFU70363.1 YolD-like family protein [Peribacillus saganii]
MGIKDRGKLKWQGAFFMPEHVKLLRDMHTDYHRISKPILDEYQIEEYENKICYAMEFVLSVKVTVWEDGFEKEYIGKVCRLDEIHKVIYLKLHNEEGYIMRIKFDTIVGVVVLE